MKRSYVLEQMNKDLENELKNLKTSARLVTEASDQEIQTDEVDVLQRIADRDYELNLSLEIEKRTLRRIIAHKI